MISKIIRTLIKRKGPQYPNDLNEHLTNITNNNDIDFLVSKGVNKRWWIADACKEGQLDTIKKIIASGLNANDYNSGLIGACRGGYLDLVELMISKGADDLYSAIYFACLQGNKQIIDYLIQKHDTKDDYYLFFLNQGLTGACEGGHRQVVDELITLGADSWNSGLRCACGGGHIEIIELMINKGADVNYGLYNACCNGNMDIVQLMISKGADNWDQGLIYACVGGQEQMVNLMINKGVNHFNLNEGLYHACQSGHYKLVKKLIKLGANNFNQNFNYIFFRDNTFRDNTRNKLIQLLIKMNGTTYGKELLKEIKKFRKNKFLISLQLYPVNCDCEAVIKSLNH